MSPDTEIAPLPETAAPAKIAAPAQSFPGPPQGPPQINTFYLTASGAGKGLTYYPAVIGRMDVHYSNARYKVDNTETLAFLSELEDGPVASKEKVY